MNKIEKAGQLLKNEDKTKRLAAIKYLLKSGDPDALPLLAWSAKHDPDPQVQAIATKAYRKLKETQEASEYRTDDLQTQQDNYFDDAQQSLYAENSNTDTVDPLFQFDDAGEPGDSFNDGTYTGKPKKTKQKNSDKNLPDWGTAWVDIAIFGLILTAGLVSIALIGTTRFAPFLETVANNPTEYREILVALEMSPDDLSFVVQMMQTSLITILVFSAGYSLLSLVGVLIQVFAIHFAAVNFFEGQNPTSVTMDRMINFYSMITGISFAIIIVTILLIPNNPAAYYSEATSMQATGIFLGMFLGLVIVGLVSAIGQIVVVARAQEISFLSGCLSIFVGGLMLSAIQCGLSFFANIVFLGAALAGG